MTETFSTFRTDKIAASGLRELGALMRGFARRIGADAYLLFEHRPQTRSVGLIACDWPFDMIAEIGSEGLDHLASAKFTTGPGEAAELVAWSGGAVSEAAAAAAGERGYSHLICQSLPVGDVRFVAVYCARDAAAVSVDEAELAQMRTIYALSQRLKPADAAEPSPLSMRERECLSWVAEGKTTDEVAVILGVSSNTINAYIAKAIQKVAATNRAMAIATAIRAGMI